MLYLIDNYDDLEKFNELVSLQNRVRGLRLQDKVGKQNFHGDMKKVFEPVTALIKKTSEGVTKNVMVPSKANSKVLAKINNKLSEILNDRGALASYLLTLLSTSTNTEHTCQFKPVKDLISNRVNDRLINKTIPVTFYDNLIIFRDSNKKFDLKGILLKMISSKNYSACPASLLDKNLISVFAKEIKFDE